MMIRKIGFRNDVSKLMFFFSFSSSFSLPFQTLHDYYCYTQEGGGLLLNTCFELVQGNP